MRIDYEKFVDEKIREIAKGPIVLDVGGGERFGKWLAKYQDLFEGVQYKTFDYDSRIGADIVGDIHALSIPSESIDAVICASVLEHVRDPRQAIKEIYRVLKSGGRLLLSVPSIYPYHARRGAYPDYWRFFEETLQDLCKDFKSIEMAKRGGYFTALSFFVPFQHKLQWFLSPIVSFFDRLFRTDQRITTSGFIVYAIK